MNLKTWLCSLAVILPFAAQAQTAPQDVAPALRGTYAAPSCAAPERVLYVTARSVLRVAQDGESRLYRGQSIGTQSDWTVLNGTGTDAPRIILRAAEQGVVEGLPDAKLRDNQLPGDTPTQTYARCTEAPAILTPFGEGIAFLNGLEASEPSCQNGLDQTCLAALFTYADVTKDRALSTAEIARAVRGATWMLQVLEGAKTSELAVGYAASTLLGSTLAQVIVRSYDYDNSGTLSLAELNQDRQPFPLAVTGARSAAVAPVPLDKLLEALRPLRRNLGEAAQSLSHGH